MSHGVVETLRGLYALRCHANHPLGATTPLRRGFTHPGFHEAFGFQPVERRIKSPDGALSPSGGFNFFPNRGAIGLASQPSGSGDQRVFEFAQHDYNYIVIVFVQFVKPRAMIGPAIRPKSTTPLRCDMATTGNQPAIDLEQHLAFELTRVVEEGAVAAARTMGQGDRKGSDHAAVQAMRRAFESVPIAGNIVIGEGERDEAPMLYIGEAVGAPASKGVEYPAVDIAVDPLEGTNLCATGAANSIAVLAASEAGGLLHAPDCYMEKIIAGPAAQGALDIDAPVIDNLRAIARRLERHVMDLVVIVLDRPRHGKLIADIREAGARIR